MNKLAVFLGLFLVGNLLNSKLRFIRSLSFSIFKVDYSGGLARPSLSVTLLIQNPTSETLTIKAIAGKCYLNGTFIGEASTVQPFDLSTGRNLLTLSGVPKLEVVPALLNVLNTKSGIFSFEGTVKIFEFNFPVSFDYKFY